MRLLYLCLGAFGIAAATAQVTQPAANQLTAPRATITGDYRIDGDKEQLVDFRFVIPLATGGVAIDQGRDQQIRYYDAKGKKTAAFGRKGKGPGEFLLLSEMGNWGDTLWIFDATRQLVTVVSPSQKLVSLIPTAGLSFAVAGALRDSSFVGLAGARFMGRPATSGGMQIDSTTWIVHYDSLRRIRKVIATWQNFVPPQGIPIQTTGGGIVPAVVPGGWFAFPQCDILADATRLACAFTTITSPSGGTVRILIVTANGDTVLRRDIPFAAEPITNAQADEMVDRVISQLGSSRGGAASKERLEASRRMLRATVPAARKPLVTLRYASDGCIWLRLRDVPDGQLWLKLDHMGVPVSSIVLPLNSHGVLQATGSHVWTSEPDADGVPSLVRYLVR